MLKFERKKVQERKQMERRWEEKKLFMLNQQPSFDLTLQNPFEQVNE